jgi:hypothetical protein
MESGHGSMVAHFAGSFFTTETRRNPTSQLNPTIFGFYRLDRFLRASVSTW